MQRPFLRGSQREYDQEALLEKFVKSVFELSCCVEKLRFYLKNVPNIDINLDT